MKTITLLCLISITSGHLLAMAGPGAPDTIHKLFHEEFPTIENPLFYREADTFGVFLKQVLILLRESFIIWMEK